MKKFMLWAFGFIAIGAMAVMGGWVYATSNVATPEYRVVESDGNIEIRNYPALRVAEVERQGARLEAVRAGFRPLAGYIFAKERDGEKIAMTAPVTQYQNGNAWKVHFIMPKEYQLADLPKPSNGEVTIRELPAVTRAAIRFAGRLTDENIGKHEQKLRQWLNGRGYANLPSPTYAYYNDPMTLPAFRRNEVIFDLPQ